jgi:hypothetical protein
MALTRYRVSPHELPRRCKGEGKGKMRIYRCAALLLLTAVLAGCAEGAPPPRLPTGPWQQLNNWDGQWGTWQPTQAELQSLPK